MNEAGRCAVLLPALALLPGPPALIEVGASAGLCPYPDRYSYRYDGHPEPDPGDGLPGAADLHHHRTPPLPREPPAVPWRAGIDLAPLDVDSDDDPAWLAA